MEEVYPGSLSYIKQQAIINEEDNLRFGDLLNRQDQDEVDKTVFRLNDVISAVIDCTACGNCCRSLMINVSKPEIKRIAERKNLTNEDAISKWVETGSGGMMIVNTIPCHFLSENKCTVYDLRFEGCREFPHLHRPHFSDRYFSVMMNYAICPITYNVVEALKKELQFHP